MTFRQWRKDRKLNQIAAAKLLGLTQPALSRLEADESAASLMHALRIFDKTGVRIGPLVDATEPDIDSLRKFLSEGARA